MYAWILKTIRILIRVFIDRVIQEEGLYVYNMHNIEEKYFLTSIAPVRSRGGSLVVYIQHVWYIPHHAETYLC
jgi:hypothetical protein